jgi:deoxyribonuclease V
MEVTASAYDTLKIDQAKAIQDQLREQISLLPMRKQVMTIAGADISLNRFSEVIYAGLVLLRYEDMQPIACSLVKGITRFPYVPGFLAFREVPALVRALEQMPVQPDVIMVDGHGIAHPRRMGIAAHLGSLIDVPTLGCAKKLLFGKYQEPEHNKGAYEPIKDKQETIGYALRTKSRVKEVFISPGHRMSMEDSLTIALHCSGAYRIPEPTRRAHEFVNLFRTGQLQEGYYTLPGHSSSLF